VRKCKKSLDFYKSFVIITTTNDLFFPAKMAMRIYKTKKEIAQKK
jgi:hypothetical protein